MKLTGENRSTRGGKTCPSATLTTTNPTWIDPGSNPGLRGERPATNRPSHGTATPGLFAFPWLLSVSTSFQILTEAYFKFTFLPPPLNKLHQISHNVMATHFTCSRKFVLTLRYVSHTVLFPVPTVEVQSATRWRHNDALSGLRSMPALGTPCEPSLWLILA
jgi:hypothetical protein